MFGGSPELCYETTAEDNDVDRMTPEFDALMKNQEAAYECFLDGKDENAWCQAVVRPLLDTALHKPDLSIWLVESV